MNMSGIYLDYNACAPLKSGPYQKMLETLRFSGNPSSVHRYGRHLSGIVEEARQQVAKSLDAHAGEIIFTSCGSEANNLVIRGFEEQGVRLLVGATDHVSTLYASEKVVKLPVTSQGIVNIDVLEDFLKDQSPALVSVHMANNETGVIQPIEDIARLVKSYGAFMHTDAIQAVGRLPISFRSLGVDALTIASSKVGGPSGAAALVLKEGVPCPSLIRGGGQEKNRRAGTHNAAAIAGFGIAVQEAVREDWNAAEKLRDYFEQTIQERAPDVEIYGSHVPRLPNTSLLRMPGMSNEIQLMRLDLAGYAVSAGSACSSGKISASHVLLAMGVSETNARETIRISLCPMTTREEIDSLLEGWFKIYEHRQLKAA